MNDAQIKHMVSRFLGWKLPTTFSPDAGINFKAEYNDSPATMALLGIDKPMRHEPVGTNLFSAVEAEAMVRHMTKGLPVGGAMADIAAERQRQIDAEGWTPEHDDKHSEGEMACAAGIYALIAGSGATDYRNAYQGYSLNDYLQAIIDHYWPWDRKWFKPKSRRRDLVKAGALIVAEIERLDRLAAKDARP
ncbi:hypothetical protein [Mesorhizobium sp.]|uniref:hypothetical protein n=1 Tax=Mesorhizobium sp. TaxID=1871066 RepID=UPI0025CF6E71|nr:hypothetical protein [Mesorhizobium sp.]